MASVASGPVAYLDQNQFNVAKGDILYRQGDSRTAWFEVDSGIIRTCRHHSDGSRQVVGFFFEGDVFGTDREHHSTTAEAVTDAVVTRVCQTNAVDSVNGVLPDGFLQRALESADRSLFLFGRRKAASRLAAFLIHFAERSGSTDKIHLPMSRDDIADHLGLTVETVSRTFSELARRGVLLFCSSHLIAIVDPAELHRLAGDEYEPSASVGHGLHLA